MAAKKVTKKTAATTVEDTATKPAATKAAPRGSLADLRKAIKIATKKEPSSFYAGQIPHYPTGIIQIDTLFGGVLTETTNEMICPGLPKGRMGEIYGAESSGKTTLACQFVSNVQRNGGTAMYLDYENTLHHGYAKKIGVDFDPDKLLIFTPDTLEEGMKMIFMACKTKTDIIVVDSVSAMIPKAEYDRKIDDNAKVGAQASQFSRFSPKIIQWLNESGTALVFINQTRSLISSSSYAGETDNTSGGKALKFYYSWRLKTTRIRSDSVERNDPVTFKRKKFPYGNLVNVKCVKNKMVGHQNHSAEIFIRFGCGVDEQLSLIESAIPRKLIKKAGAHYTVNGESLQGKDRLRKWLLANPRVEAQLKEQVVKAIAESATKVAQNEELDFDDDDIVSDMRAEIGDDDLFDDGEDPAPFEELVEAEIDEADLEAS